MSKAEFSDSMSRPAMNALRENLDQNKVKYNPELYDLLGKSAVVFSASMAAATAETSGKVFSTLCDNMLAKILASGLYERILTNERAEDILNSDSSLKRSKNIYLDTLTAVSVSDKEISNPLGKTLKVDNLLIFQLDHLPSASLKFKKSDNYIRMKLRLVEAESGYIIWSGTVERFGLSDEELKELVPVSLALSDTLAEAFLNTFKRKWHKKIFENLAKL